MGMVLKQALQAIAVKTMECAGMHTGHVVLPANRCSYSSKSIPDAATDAQSE